MSSSQPFTFDSLMMQFRRVMPYISLNVHVALKCNDDLPNTCTGTSSVNAGKQK